MAIKSRKFTKGIRIKPNSTPTALSGEISVSSTDNKVKVTTEVPADYTAQVYNVGDKVRHTDDLNYICIQTTTGTEDPSNASYWEVYERSIVTEDQTQTLENKTAESLVLNTGVSGTAVKDEDDMVSDSATHLATQQSIKAYVDSQVAGKDDASEITYTPSTLADWTDSLDPGNTDGGLDQLASRIKDRENNAAISDGEQGNLVALSGRPVNSTDHGTFAGTTITDGVTTKVALQELETEVETKITASSTDNLTNKSIISPDRLDVKQDTEANLITYAASFTAPAGNGQMCFATDTKKMYQIIDEELEPVGGGGSTSFEISQTTHGLAVGEGIYHNGTNYVKGQANASGTLAYHVVVEVIVTLVELKLQLTDIR
jgi:hypothetical protein